MKILTLAMLLLVLAASVECLAGEALRCQDPLETPEFTSSKLLDLDLVPGETDEEKKANLPPEMPVRVSVDFLPEMDVPDEVNGGTKDICTANVRVWMRPSRSIEDGLLKAAAEIPQTCSRLRIHPQEWVVSSESQAAVPISVNAEVRKCGTHFWIRCRHFRCAKHRQPYRIDIGNASTAFRAQLGAALTAEQIDGIDVRVPELRLGNVEREGEVSINASRTTALLSTPITGGASVLIAMNDAFGGDLPNVIANFFVEGTVDSLVDDALKEVNNSAKAHSVTNANGCLSTGGWKGGAKVCLEDPISGSRLSFESTAFIMREGPWFTALHSRRCWWVGTCTAIEQWMKSAIKIIENKEIGAITVQIGGSLWKISESAYGSGHHWVALASINHLERSGAHVLQPGQTLFVPRPSELYGSSDPAVILTGSSLWNEWVDARASCPDGTSRIAWTELVRDQQPQKSTVQGERPKMCVPTSANAESAPSRTL